MSWVSPRTKPTHFAVIARLDRASSNHPRGGYWIARSSRAMTLNLTNRRCVGLGFRRSHIRILMRRPVCTAAQNDYVGTMDAVTSRPLPGRPLAVPNLLTYARIVAVPLVVACMYWQAILAGGVWFRLVALVVFLAAGGTHILDGYFSRSPGPQSSLCRLLGPIARKL